MPEVPGNTPDVEVNLASERIDEDLRLFRDCLSQKDERLSERMKRLAREFKALGHKVWLRS